MRTLLILLTSTVFIAPAQIVSFGVKAGAPLMEALPYDSAGQYVDTGRWTVGPTVEFHLPARVSIEIDALYLRHRVISSMAVNGPGVTATLLDFRNSVKAWDFPLLLKYRFGKEAIHPFVDAGFQLTHESSNFTTRCLSNGAGCASVSIPAPFEDSLNRAGPVAGAGVEFRRGRLRFAPEVRYTRLNKPSTNQVTILVGVTF